MLNHLIVIEGPDNCGKSSLALELTKNFRCMNDITLMHSIRPDVSKCSTANEMLNLQKSIFLNQVEKIIKICKCSNNNIIIMDRSWYGEYVYGQIYRNESPDDIIKMLNEIDNYIYNNEIRRSTFLTNAQAKFISNNDDKKSFFSNLRSIKKIDAIQKEIDLFKECFNKTLLSNDKLKDSFMILNVEQDMKFINRKNLLNSALSFINKNAG